MEWRGAQLNGCQYTFGMVHNVQYSGVLLSDICREVGVKPSAKWVLAEGGDSAGMNRSVPIEKILDDCMIAYSMNGEALQKERGVKSIYHNNSIATWLVKSAGEVENVRLG
jgi:sulfane dehydrogenase subunit SoxC